MWTTKSQSLKLYFVKEYGKADCAYIKHVAATKKDKEWEMHSKVTLGKDHNRFYDTGQQIVVATMELLFSLFVCYLQRM